MGFFAGVTNWFKRRGNQENKSGVKIVSQASRTRDASLILKKGSAQSARAELESNNYPVIDAGPSTDGVSDVIHFRVTDDADESNARSLISIYILQQN